MAKRKGHFENEAHFVSHLSIEECTYRLEALNGEVLRIEIVHLSSDKVDFKAALHEHGRLRAEGNGALRRWEGTLTRVECKVKVRDGLVVWALLSLAALVSTMLIIPVIVLIAAGTGAQLWLLLGSICVLATVGLMYLAQRFSPPDDTPQNLIAIIEEALN